MPEKQETGCDAVILTLDNEEIRYVFKINIISDRGFHCLFCSLDVIVPVKEILIRPFPLQELNIQ